MGLDSVTGYEGMTAVVHAWRIHAAESASLRAHNITRIFSALLSLSLCLTNPTGIGFLQIHLSGRLLSSPGQSQSSC